jgi:hypothetical protein
MASFIALASSLAAFSLVQSALALPAASSPVLYAPHPEGHGTMIWLSNAAPKIFGADATNFDYIHATPNQKATEAVETYHKAVLAGEEDGMITAFLNATQGGTMIHDKASDLLWKCRELGPEMASHTKACKDVSHDMAPEQAQVIHPSKPEKLSKRNYFSWNISYDHKSSAGAVEALEAVLGSQPTIQFPQSPRSICVTFRDTQACLSWSSVQDFNYAQGRNFIDDALTVVNFDAFSAQTNRALGSGADVCISNRPNGCT